MNELIEVNSMSLVREKDIKKHIYFLEVLMLQTGQLRSRHMRLGILHMHCLGKWIPGHCKGPSVSLIRQKWNVLQNIFNMLSCEALIILYIVALKGHEHFLFVAAHEELQEEIHKFIMVNSLITILIDLSANPVAYDLR